MCVFVCVSADTFWIYEGLWVGSQVMGVRNLRNIFEKSSKQSIKVLQKIYDNLQKSMKNPQKIYEKYENNFWKNLRKKWKEKI